MRVALLIALLLPASALLAACSASPGNTNVAIGEPATVIVPPATNPAPPLEAAPPVPAPHLALEWSLNGDTPTVAWSPDGTRLAISDQVNYLSTPADPKTVGIDVLDVSSGERTRVHKGPGYHPVWLTGDSIAFGCSPYECNKTEGVYLLPLNGGAARRVLTRGVYHTRASKGGDVLFFSGFPEDEGWMLMDTSRFTTRAVGGSKDSWKPPSDTLADQCPPKASGKRVEARDGKVVLHAEDGRMIDLISTPPWLLSWPEDNRIIKPCLSPDGRFVVYFTQRRGHGLIGVRSLDTL